MADKNKLKNFITPKTDLKPNNIFDDYFKNPIPSTSISKKPITQQQNKIPNISTGTGAGTQIGSNDTTPLEDKTIRSGAIRIVMPDITPQATQTDDSDSRFLASLIGQGTAMLGAGIQGRSLSDVAEQFNYMRELDKRREYQKQQDEERKLQQKKAQEQLDELTNPNSAISKSRRSIYSKVLGGIEIPPEISASDLSDSFILRGLQQQAEEARIARMPKPTTVGTKQKTEKPFKFEESDIKENAAINELRNLTNDLSQSVKNYGNPLFGAEEKNQNTLKYGIAATMLVLKGQGAMTEPDIEFWNKNLKSGITESPDEYSKRLKNLQKNLINKRINALENRGLEVQYDKDSNQYFIFRPNDPTILGKF